MLRSGVGHRPPLARLLMVGPHDPTLVSAARRRSNKYAALKTQFCSRPKAAAPATQARDTFLPTSAIKIPTRRGREKKLKRFQLLKIQSFWEFGQSLDFWCHRGSKYRLQPTRRKTGRYFLTTSHSSEDVSRHPERLLRPARTVKTSGDIFQYSCFFLCVLSTKVAARGNVHEPAHPPPPATRKGIIGYRRPLTDTRLLLKVKRRTCSN